MTIDQWIKKSTEQVNAMPKGQFRSGFRNMVLSAGDGDFVDGHLSRESYTKEIVDGLIHNAKRDMKDPYDSGHSSEYWRGYLKALRGFRNVVPDYQGDLKPWMDEMLATAAANSGVYKDGVLDTMYECILEEGSSSLVRDVLQDRISDVESSISVCEEEGGSCDGHGKRYWEGMLFVLESLRDFPSTPDNYDDWQEKRREAKRTPDERDIMARAGELLSRFEVDDYDEVDKQCKRSTVFDTSHKPLSKQENFIKELHALAVKLEADRSLSTRTTTRYVRDYISEGARASRDGEREYSMFSFPCVRIEVLKGGTVVDRVDRNWPPPDDSR